MSTTSWGKATRQGIIWSTASFLGGRALTFVSIVVLARLLTPDEFGVVAAITVFLALLDVVSDVGMKATVIYEQEHGVTDRVQTAFTVNLAFATILTVAGVVLAPAIAQFFHMQEHADLFRLASLNLLLTGLGNVHDALLLRELDFRRRIIPDLARGLVRGVVSIVLALSGMNAAALVIGMLAGSAAWTALQWTLTAFRPALSFEASIARSMAGYGTGAATLATVSSVLSTVELGVIGRVLGEHALGLYTVARRLPELVIEMVAFNVSRVAFPALARKRATAEHELGDATLAVLRYQAMYAGPAAAGLAVLASPLVVVLFSSKWRDAGGVLTAQAVMSGVGTIAYPLGDLLKAVGKQWLLVALNLVQLPFVVAGIVLLGPQGIVAVAWLLAGAMTLFCAGLLAVARRQQGLSVRAVIAAARPGLVAAAGVAAGAGAVRLAWPDLSIGPVVAAMLAGTACGLLSLRLFARGALSEVMTAIGWSGRLPRRRRSPGSEPDRLSG